MNTVRKGKINRHEKITQVLLSGKPVTPDEIASVFKGTDQEAVLYRLSTNIYNIRKDGGIVKVIKEGRNVKAYQLVNYTEFNLNGRYVGKIVPAAAPAVAEVTEVQETETAEA
jgi:DNA-binding transcriptional ArsR family regulator